MCNPPAKRSKVETSARRQQSLVTVNRLSSSFTAAVIATLPAPFCRPAASQAGSGRYFSGGGDVTGQHLVEQRGQRDRIVPVPSIRRGQPGQVRLGSQRPGGTGQPPRQRHRVDVGEYGVDGKLRSVPGQYVQVL